MKTLKTLTYNAVRLFALLMMILTVESCSKDDTVSTWINAGMPDN